MNKKLTLLLGVTALVIQPLMSQTTVGAYLGFNDTLAADQSTTSPALTNPVEVNWAGVAYDGGNRDIDDPTNIFDLDLGSFGTASFRVNRNNEGDSGWLRQYDEGINGIGDVSHYIRIELTALTVGTTLTLDQIGFNSLDADSDFSAVLPDGSSVNGAAYTNMGASWSAGETLRLVGVATPTGSYNLAGFQVTAVPEPATTALLLGVVGLGLVIVRRRIKR